MSRIRWNHRKYILYGIGIALLVIVVAALSSCSGTKSKSRVDIATEGLKKEILLPEMMNNLNDVKQMYANKKYEDAYKLAKETYAAYAPYRNLLPKENYDEMETYLNVTAWAYERKLKGDR